MYSITCLKESARIASTPFYQQIADPTMQEAATLEESIKAGHFVDTIKKSLFYGKALDAEHPVQKFRDAPTDLDPSQI